MSKAQQFFTWLADFFGTIFEFLFSLDTGLGFSYGTVLLALCIFDIAIYIAGRALSNQKQQEDHK